MTATVLDGWATAKEIRADLSARVARLKEQGVTPGLGTILVGDDPGSHAYVTMKHRDSGLIGIDSIDRRLPATATQAEVEAAVRELNEDPNCHAYLVQLPLPKGLDEKRVLELMDPAKDADGLHPMSLGRLVLGIDAPLPCTPNGIVELLHRPRADQRRGDSGIAQHPGDRHLRERLAAALGDRSEEHTV